MTKSVLKSLEFGFLWALILMLCACASPEPYDAGGGSQSGYDRESTVTTPEVDMNDPVDRVFSPLDEAMEDVNEDINKKESY
jgi:hypothetical protein